MTSEPDAQFAGRRGAYRRFFAWLMTRIGPDHDELIADRKRELLGPLRGHVAEIGPGAGINLDYLDAGVRYVAIEPNVHMHPYLHAEAERLGRDIEIRTGVAERLPLEDASVDAILSTLVLCSVDDVSGVLTEVRRVLRPGGRFVFIEHVAAAPGSRTRWWQGAVKPLWKRLGDGCEPDRDLASVIEAAGFAHVSIASFSAELPLAIVRPHIAGSATKAGDGAP